MWGRRRVVPHLSVGCGCDWSASAGASCTPTGGGQRSEISGGQFGQFAATGGVLKITQGGRDLGRPFPGWVGGRKRGPSDAGRWLRRLRLFNAHSVRPHSPRASPPTPRSLARSPPIGSRGWIITTRKKNLFDSLVMYRRIVDLLGLGSSLRDVFVIGSVVLVRILVA